MLVGFEALPYKVFCFTTSTSQLKSLEGIKQQLMQTKAWRKFLIFYLNGQRVTVPKPDPSMTLLEYLRDVRGLTGAKLGCGEGGCGACCVTVTRPEAAVRDSKMSKLGLGHIMHRSVNSCLAPLCSVDGCHVTTIEGVGTSNAPHPIQARFAKAHSNQCGFCTPGFVMSLYSTLQANPTPTARQVQGCLEGNLCRCTGYRPILDAALTFASDQASLPQPPECTIQPKSGKMVVSGSRDKHRELAADAPYNPSNHPPPSFPEELHALARDPLHFDGNGCAWYRPQSLEELLELKQKFPRAQIVGGASEIQVDAWLKKVQFPVYISPSAVSELHALRANEDGVIAVGGAVSLAQLEAFLESFVSTHPAHQVQAAIAIKKMLAYFASHGIRNTATLAGNICTASPISDTIPILLCCNAQLHLQSQSGGRRVVAMSKFITGYRKTELRPDEILVLVSIPPTAHGEVVHAFKQARRRDDDISIVSACFRAQVQPVHALKKWKIVEFFSGFGGMAPTSATAKHLEAAMKGMELHVGMNLAPAAIAEAIAADFPLTATTPGGMAAYRMTLAASFVTKFLARVCRDLGIPVDGARDAAASYMDQERPVSTGTQIFQYCPESGGLVHSCASEDKATGRSLELCPSHAVTGVARPPVGEPLCRPDALQNCAGETEYIDDIPTVTGTLHGAFVFSDRPVGTIKSIEPAEALSSQGVVAFFSAKDLSEQTNRIGPVVHDEELFRRGTVTSAGQPVGLVVATSHKAAEIAALRVKVEYEPLSTEALKKQAVLTIAAAIQHKSFLKPLAGDGKDYLELKSGDPKASLAKAEVVLEGEVRIGSQEHFYLEPQCALAVPGSDELTLFSSTQCTSGTQSKAASVCGLPAHRVISRVKKIGGGFGGKETRSEYVAAAASFAAHRLRKPVKIVLERAADMSSSGARHPFYARYRVGASKEGKIHAVEVDLFSNAGYSRDLSEPVISRALFHVDNAYKFENLRARGTMCLTNTPTNTAFRGFGGTQGLLMADSIVDHVASALAKDPAQIRKLNMYREGDRTHYGQEVTHWNLPRIWEQLLETSMYETRRDDISKFNLRTATLKRGIAAIPVKFGCSFTAKFMNQGAALVHVYTDGTVLVTHGGVEMGQGLNLKCIQVAARAFGIDASRVHIAETASDKVPNTIATAASLSSDLYGMAILNACEQIQQRLAPYRAKIDGEAPTAMPNEDRFAKAASAAFLDRVNLSAQGFYRVPSERCGFDWSIGNGNPFNYYSQGAACCEVEIDVLTGDLRVRRADIVMDVGSSLNPAIDIGQVEGAFIQGVGYYTLEETVFGCSEHPWIAPGACFTRGPGSYKIPSAGDVPIDFRVTLLHDCPNPRAIHSSKGIGEPPLFLGSAAFFAAKHAIASARIDALGKEIGAKPFYVDSPLTAERIRMACGDPTSVYFQECLGASRPGLFC